MSAETDAEFPVESWTPFPNRDDALYGEYTPARVMTDDEAIEHARKLAAKFDAAGIPRPEWLRDA